jgi:cytochrome c oxidase cbb3-type subunit I/II
MRAQAAKIADGLKKGGIDVEADREIVAMIAYLQRLGTDIKKPLAGVGAEVGTR